MQSQAKFIGAASSVDSQEGSEKSGQVKCQEGQDEIFDNCIKVEKPDPEAAD